MVRTDEFLAGIALALHTELRSSMGTTVVQDAHGTVARTHHQHTLAADLDRDIVSRVSDLGLVSAIHPGRFEDVVELRFEHALIGITEAMNPIGFDKSFRIFLHILEMCVSRTP